LLSEKDTLTVSAGKLLLNGSDVECYVCEGCPFTFEYEGDTYKVVGIVRQDILDNNDRVLVRGATFEGTITKNQGEPVGFWASSEVDGPDGLSTPDVGCDTEDLGFTEEDEEDFLETLKQELMDVLGAYGTVRN
jgi:hypothetical protein